MKSPFARPVAGAAFVAGLAWLIVAPASAGQRPTIFWHSDPVRPGQTVLLYGDGLETVTGLRIARLPDDPAGAPGTSPALPAGAVPLGAIQPSPVSVKAILPAQWPAGVFALEAETAGGRSAVVRLNAPQIAWVQGDAGLEATPGGWVRAFGRCLGWPDMAGRALIRLEGPRSVTLPATGDSYAVQAALPADLPTGRYQVFVHNGRGGPMAWSAPEPLQVTTPWDWPAHAYNVRQFGAAGDGLRDDTVSFMRVLDAAAATGGVIYIPRGRYRLSATLPVPPQTLLRGEGQDLSHLYWTNPHTARLECVVRGRHHFGLEDLTLWFIGAENGILSDQSGPALGHVRLRRLRARWALYGGYLKIATANEIFAQTAVDGGAGARGALVRLAGPNIEVSQCDLYSSACPLVLTAADGARIADNQMYIGRLGYVLMWSGRRTTWENNRMLGADSMSRAGIFFPARPYTDKLYFARNSVERIFAHDAETFSTDGAYPQYFGPIRASTETVVTLPAPQTWRLQGPTDHALFVIAGKGKGQYRSIVKHTDSSVTIDRPWTVVPDASSVIGINQSMADWLIVGNRFVDGVSVQLYGIAFNAIFADNELTRIGGNWEASLRSLGFRHAWRDERGTEPNFFVQFLGNRITEAVRLDYRQFRMGTNAIEVLAAAPSAEWAYPFQLAPVVRDNTVNGGEIVLVASGGRVPQIEDAIVEDNAVENADVGIVVPKATAGVLLRGNRFRRVVRPLVGEGLEGAWMHPAERTRARLIGLLTLVGEQAAAPGAEPPEWKGLLAELEELARKPADVPDLQAAGQALQGRAVAALARWRPGGHSAETLAALCGLTVLPGPGTTALGYQLTDGRARPSKLELAVSLRPDVQPLRLTVRPAWPKTWKSAVAQHQVDLQPGSTAAVGFPVELPAEAWGPFDVPVELEAAVFGVTLTGRLVLTVGRGEVREWMCIGPFANRDAPQPDTHRHPPEDGIDLNATYPGLAGPVTWQPVRLTGPQLQPDQWIKTTAPATAYALACVRAQEPLLAELTIQGQGLSRAWLNDELLTVSFGRGPVLIPVALRAGDNFLLLKLCRGEAGWSAQVALGRLDGRARVVPAAALKQIPALAPPPATQSGGLPFSAGVAWQLIYSDDFQRSQIGPRWRPASGTWKIAAGTLRGEDRAFIAFADKLAAPWRIEYEASSAAPADLSAFWLDTPGDYTSGLLIAFAAGGPSSRIQIGDQILGAVAGPKVSPHQWQRVIAQVLPSGRIQLIANGQIVLDCRPSKPLEGARYVGLWAWGQGVFDNVKLYTAAR